MPKLNTTVNKLELIDNKMLYNDGLPSSSWQDDKYPSARSLYRAYNSLNSKINTKSGELAESISTLDANIDSRIDSKIAGINISKSTILDMVYPVGSVYTTSQLYNASYELINPAGVLGGGTWELYDAAFDPHYVYITKESGLWTSINASLNPSGYIYFSGHTMVLNLALKTTKAAKDSANDSTKALILGKLELGKLNMAHLPYTIYQNAGISNNGQSVFDYTIDKLTGGITILDALTISGTGTAGHNMPSGSSLVINQIFTFHDPLGFGGEGNAMPGDKVGTVFWRRIA
jgi:hypothetical protein